MVHFGYEQRVAGQGCRFNSCPACGDGNSGKFWAKEEIAHCHSCGFAGDVFAVLGAILDLDPQVHFPDILSRAAAIAGIDDGEQRDLHEHRAQKQQIHETERKRRVHECELAEEGAKKIWAKLLLHSAHGHEYLASRGVLPQTCSICRYGHHSVCLPLWRDDKIVNVVGRRFISGKPKIRGLASCRTQGTFGRPVPGDAHTGPVVLVEGFFDYLSARQMWPSCLVLGAHGCANLTYAATLAADVIKGTSTELVVVAHIDEAGQNAMQSAIKAATEAGVPTAAIGAYELATGCNDLNDELVATSLRSA